MKACIQKSGKRFTITRDVLTRANIKKYIKLSPSILHFSCHGLPKSLDIEKDPSNIENIGLLDELTPEELKNDFLKDNGEEDKELTTCLKEIELGLISACHSEDFGKILALLGIKVTISVNESQPIHDAFISNYQSEHIKRLL